MKKGKRYSIISQLYTGLFISVDNIFTAATFTTIVFQGKLYPFSFIFFSILLITIVLINAYHMIRSPVQPSIVQLQDEFAVLYAAMILILLHTLPNTLPSEVLFLAAVLLIGGTTILTGLTFYLLGKFELGNIVRYLPFPVIGGFLVATGWLIFSGTIKLLIGSHDLSTAFHADILWLWLPSFTIGAIIFILKKFTNYRYVVQMIILISMILYYLYFNLDGSYPVELASQNAVPHSTDFLTTLQSALASIVFTLPLVGYMAIIILTSAIQVLLNTSSIELFTGKSIDLNHELSISGVSNILSGLMGGVMSCLSVSMTRLTVKQHSSKIGILMSFLPLIPVLFFVSFIQHILPKPIIGIIMFNLSLLFFWEWLVGMWNAISRYEYFIMVFILASSIYYNILVAVMLGLIISTALFAFRYSRINPSRYFFWGTFFNSAYERGPEQDAILKQYGHELVYLKLQGYLFFGSINSLFNTIKNISGAKYIILDFELVENIDSSRITFIDGLKKIAKTKLITFVFCSIKHDLLVEVKKSEQFIKERSWLLFLPDRERSLQYCEDQVINHYSNHLVSSIPSVEHQLSLLGFDLMLAQAIANSADCKIFNKGDIICHEGDKADNIYFIHQGQSVAIVANKPVLKVNAGNFLGEVALYTNKKRSATIIAETNCVIYQINLTWIKYMEENNPKMMLMFHQSMAGIIAKRLIKQNQRVRLFQSKE